jgi:hypothetical protein
LQRNNRLTSVQALALEKVQPVLRLLGRPPPALRV